MESSFDGARYAELRAKSCYSFLRGASTPEELVRTARERGLEVLGIADLETLAGAVQGHVAAKREGLRLLIGAEVRPSNGVPLVLYPVDRAGYGRLARMLTLGRRRAPKGSCRLEQSDVSEHAAGLVAILVPPDPVDETALRSLASMKELFGDRAYLALERHLGPNDPWRVAEVAAAGRALGLELVAVNDVHYHIRERAALSDVLTCIREGRKIDDAQDLLFPNAERHLKTAAEMRALFFQEFLWPRNRGRATGCGSGSAFQESPWPRSPGPATGCASELEGAVARTLEVASRVTFSLDELRYEYPEEIVPPGSSAMSHLERLTREGAARRYPEGMPEKVRAQIEHELALVRDLRYEPFFLTVHDIVVFARERGILCQGRGSAANSAICYCLGITSVDPARTDVLFERFVSRERNEPPDIDVDFEHERREEVIQYIYEKYGRERAGLVAEVIRYRPRSAIRDVGKVMGLSLDQVDALAGAFHWWEDLARAEEAAVSAGLDPGDRRVRLTIEHALAIQGFPRHLSQHVGGMVITRGPLCELVPIENAAMEGRTVIEWDKDDIDALGILKVDCLALGMLTAIRKTFDLVAAASGRGLTLASVPVEDPETYAMCARADTIGVFQIESRAQMSMLPRLKPRTFYDLVIEVAIVRPGPIQGNMVHPYLRRRSGEEPIVYPSEALRTVLEKTLGVPLFQEQAMRLSIVAAGFSPGEADQLRRAMGAFRRPGVMEGMRARLVEGMRRNGYSGELAERLFEQLKGFGEYGFPESHATSFALLAYVSAWLKRRYPAAFTAALLNSQPMGFYGAAQLVRDAIRHGVLVRPLDVNASEHECRLEGDGGSPAAPGVRPELAAAADGLPPERWGEGGPAIRLGTCLLNGFSGAKAEALVSARRKGGPFRSVRELARRTRLSAEPLARLAAAGAFGSLGLGPRHALWEVEALGGDELPLFPDLELREPSPALPPMSPLERVVGDYASVGLSLERHPVSFLRAMLARAHATPADRLAKLPSGASVSVGGLVTVRQRPGTANGVIFMTLEDETGFANVILRPRIYERSRPASFEAPFVLVSGRLEREGEVIHVLARSIREIRLAEAARLGLASRDFR